MKQPLDLRANRCHRLFCLYLVQPYRGARRVVAKLTNVGFLIQTWYMIVACHR